MKLMIIHTTLATIQSLTRLAGELMPNVEVVNILDDSILKDLIADHNVEQVRKRWMSLAALSALCEADAVLSACSTVGEFAEEADRLLPIPVIRIDDAMAEKAVKRGGQIVVLATLQSTLDPTVSLLRRKAEKNSSNCDIQTVLVEGAYEKMMSGDKEEHDRRIKEAVMKKIDSANVIVLAQASMASALTSLDEERQKKVLTSPLSGMKNVKEKMNW